MAHSKHEQVRRRYAFCCGYCGVTEASSGGELTVDHYQPVSSGGDDSNDNLVYACFRCNLHKSDLIPMLQTEQKVTVSYTQCATALQNTFSQTTLPASSNRKRKREGFT